MTKANRKKIVKELLAAAERIETGYDVFCCNAIENYDAKIFFELVFENDARLLHDDNEMWFQEIDEYSGMPEVRSRRVLGLCWAALMAEEGVF